jgi:hypothetical protein
VNRKRTLVLVGVCVFLALAFVPADAIPPPCRGAGKKACPTPSPSPSLSPSPSPSPAACIQTTVQTLVATMSANAGARTYCVTGSGSPGSSFAPETGDRLIGEGMGATVIDFTGVAPRLNGGLYYCLFGFSGAHDNVVLQDLTVRGCGTAGAADAGATAIKVGIGWTLTRIEASNSGRGVLTGSGLVVQFSRFHDNRTFGIGGAHGTIQDSEIDHNGVPAVTGDDGGTKFHQTGNVYLYRNNVHDNLGPGIWFDGHTGGDAVAVGNTVLNNREVGIDYEITRGGDVRAENNVVRANSAASIGASCYVGEVLAQNSEDVKILNNTIDASIGSNAICVADTTRSTVEPSFPESVYGFEAIGNDITLGTQTKVGLCGTQSGAHDYTPADVFFDFNIYHGADGPRWNFKTCAPMNFATWRNLGQDQNSALVEFFVGTF